MPLVIAILCCMQVIGGILLIFATIYTYKTLRYSSDQINVAAQRLAVKFLDNQDKIKHLSKKEIDKMHGYFKSLGDNIKLQITMTFLPMYFIGSRIMIRPVIPIFSTFIFAIINIICGFSLMYGGESGWYLGIAACTYSLLRNLHALTLVPKLSHAISYKIFNVKRFYIRYSMRSFILITLICYFFLEEIRDYFFIQDSFIDGLITIEIVCVGFVIFDFLCSKVQEALE